MFNSDLGDDNTLPLSSVSFVPKSLQSAAASGAKGKSAPAAQPAAGDMVSVLKSSSVEYFARSPFSALSGKGDKFDTVDELVGSLRRGVIFDSTLIPTLDAETDNLNSCIKHSPVLSYLFALITC